MSFSSRTVNHLNQVSLKKQYSRFAAKCNDRPFSNRPCRLPVMSSSKTARVETVSDGPLSQHEVTMASGLLLRAVKHGQSHNIMNTLRSAPNSRAYWVGGSTVLQDLHAAVMQNVPGPSSMSDASKRRLPDEDDEATSWDQVSLTREDLSEAGYMDKLSFGDSNVPAPWIESRSPHLRAMDEVREDPSIPFPSDIQSVETWGKCFCETDKYKEENLKYDQLVQRAKHDTECRKYLKWLVDKYGFKPGVTPSDEKITPGKDLARFLQRSGWKASSSDVTFTRRFK